MSKTTPLDPADPAAWAQQPIIQKLHSFFTADPAGGQTTEGGAWDEAWKHNVTPWDQSEVNPALKELVEERWSELSPPVSWDSLKAGKALVAGCGRGNDAIFFAAKGLASVGQDLSATAIQIAQENLASSPNAPTNVTFEQSDFFKSALPSQLYSLAYDFTFFCALPPSMREDWAKRYSELIREGGVLLCLEYPIDGDRPLGPPYSVSPADYDRVLSPYFDKIYSRIPGSSNEMTKSRENMSVWRRKASA